MNDRTDRTFEDSTLDLDALDDACGGSWGSWAWRGVNMLSLLYDLSGSVPMSYESPSTSDYGGEW